MDKKRPTKNEVLLWSIAFPGFGQFLNRKLIKGILFIILEILINVRGHFNLAIINSFLGNIQEAIEVTNFQWLMFYPCIYFFAIWDAYRDAEGEISRYSYLPFVFAAYFVTLGLIFSPSLKLFGFLPGPVFLPMIFLIPGLVVGMLIKFMFERAAST